MPLRSGSIVPQSTAAVRATRSTFWSRKAPSRETAAWGGPAEASKGERHASAAPENGITYGYMPISQPAPDPANGNFVYVVKDNVATVTPVKVARSLGAESVIESGLKEGDVVVTDGHLLLTDKARVAVRERKPGV